MREKGLFRLVSGGKHWFQMVFGQFRVVSAGFGSFRFLVVTAFETKFAQIRCKLAEIHQFQNWQTDSGLLAFADF